MAAARRHGKIKILPHMHLKVSEIPSHPSETVKELSPSSIPIHTLNSASSKGAKVNFVDHYIGGNISNTGDGHSRETYRPAVDSRNQNQITNIESQTNLIHVDSTELNRTRLENSGKPVRKQTPKIPVRSSQTEVRSGRSSDSHHSGSPHQYQQHHPRHLYNLLHTSGSVKASKDKPASVPVDADHLSSQLQDKAYTQLKYSQSRRKLPEVPVRTSSLRNYSYSKSSSTHKEDGKHKNNMLENTCDRLSIELHETDMIEHRSTSESASENEAANFDTNIGNRNNRITDTNAAVDNNAVIVTDVSEHEDTDRSKNQFQIISGNTKDMVSQVGEAEFENDALKSFSDFLKNRSVQKHSECQEPYPCDREPTDNHTDTSRDRRQMVDYDPADDLLKEVNDLLDSADEIGRHYSHVSEFGKPVSCQKQNVYVDTQDVNNGWDGIGSGISGINNNSSTREDLMLPKTVDKAINVSKPTLDQQQEVKHGFDSYNSGKHMTSADVRGIESVKGYCDSETNCDVMINKLLSATHEVNNIVNKSDSQHSDGAKSQDMVPNMAIAAVKQFSSLCSDSVSVNEGTEQTYSSLAEVPEITVTADNLFHVADSASAEPGESRKTTQVLRSPSYRKRVMAKARTKYGRSFKKPSECTCPADEVDVSDTSDDKELCTFCQLNRNFSEAQRDTSLGAVSGGTGSFSEGEYIDQSSPRRVLTPGLPPLPFSPKPGSPRGHQKVKKVPVSSRVELLMSNDLFRKHLKRDALLRKHTYTYRKYGLQKSVSNLDLSDAFLYHDTTTDGEDTNTTDVEDELLSKSHDLTTICRDSRRHSLTESDPALEQFQNHFKSLKDDIIPRTLPKGNTKTRPTIPSFKEYRGGSGKSRRILPSFTEFRSNKPKVSNESANDELLMTGENDEPDKDLLTPSPRLELGPIAETEGKGSAEHLVDTSNSTDTILGKNGHHNKASARCKSNVRDVTVRLNNVDRDRGGISGLTREFESDSKVTPIKHVKHQHLEAPQNTGDNSTSLRQERTSISPAFSYSDTESYDSRHKLSVNETGASLASQSSFSKLKERRRKGSKRPRSLISKKSSLDELLNGSQNTVAPEKRDISERQRLRRGHSCRRPTRSKSEVCLNKVRCDLSVPSPKDDTCIFMINPDNISARHFETSGHIETSLKRINSDPTTRGCRKVAEYEDAELDCMPNFALMDRSIDADTDSGSHYSQDIGESDTTTSVAGSNISESLYSEISKVGERLGSTEDDFGSELRISADEDDLKSQMPVLRSTSDACDATPDAARKRRERKDRPYKSDPFSGTEIVPASKRYYIKEERAKLRQYRNMVSAAKDEILSFLDYASHGDLHQGDSFPSLEELNEDDEQNLNDGTSENGNKARNPSNVSTTSTDSGVIGQEWSHGSQQSSPSSTLQQGQTTWRDWEQPPGSSQQIMTSASCSDLTKTLMRECIDCGLLQKVDVEMSGNICSRCHHRAIERRKIIQEIYDTEVSYGRDLNILKQEFCLPMGKVGLLTKHQLNCIFLNLDELIHVNTHFVTKMKAAINSTQHHDDEELQDIRVGSLFLESSTMFLTFENYCVSQYQAPILLEQLEREKELLRIFLHVSQNDNQLLRRMHLKSFLMVPVQRIMKYPLLLDRLYKVTPLHHPDKTAIKEAKDKINDILSHINAKSKVGQLRQQKVVEQHYSMTEKIEVSRVAIHTLGWNRDDVCDLITSHLQIAQPVDHMWAVKKCKHLKFTVVHGVLLTLGEPFIEAEQNRNLLFARPSPVRSAAVVLIKEKNGKFQPFRDPFLLERCVVSQDPDYTDVFEILEWNKESLLLKAESQAETALWVQNLKQQMANLGCWRRRRNALPNIHLSHIT